MDKNISGKGTTASNNRYVVEQQQKWELNRQLVERIKVESVLDVFAGLKSSYEGIVLNIISNDRDKLADTTFHNDATKLCLSMAEQGNKFDLVDLDPFGSCFDCIEPVTQIAQKGLIISYGDACYYWRFKKFEQLKERYCELWNNINSVKDYNRVMREYTIQLGKKYDKNLVEVSVWNPIWFFFRVYYVIEGVKYAKV